MAYLLRGKAVRISLDGVCEGVHAGIRRDAFGQSAGEQRVENGRVRYEAEVCHRELQLTLRVGRHCCGRDLGAGTGGGGDGDGERKLPAHLERPLHFFDRLFRLDRAGGGQLGAVDGGAAADAQKGVAALVAVAFRGALDAGKIGVRTDAVEHGGFNALAFQLGEQRRKRSAADSSGSRHDLHLVYAMLLENDGGLEKASVSGHKLLLFLRKHAESQRHRALVDAVKNGFSVFHTITAPEFLRAGQSPARAQTSSNAGTLEMPPGFSVESPALVHAKRTISSSSAPSSASGAFPVWSSFQTAEPPKISPAPVVSMV